VPAGVVVQDRLGDQPIGDLGPAGLPRRGRAWPMGADAVVLAPGQLSGAIRRQLGSQVGLHRHLVEQGEVDLVELGTRLAGPDEPACELTQVADGVESPGQDNTARWGGTSRTPRTSPPTPGLVPRFLNSGVTCTHSDRR
jgi:hypothetical protein